MAFYETVFIGRQDLSETQVKQLTESVTSYITSQKGTVKKTENWGLRTLAYRISKNRKGHYVLIEFSAETSIIAETERQLRLNEDVLRYVTVRLAAPSEAESAVLRAPEESNYKSRERSGDTGYRPRKPQQEAA